MVKTNLIPVFLSSISVILCFLTPYGLSPDEAHYWLWSNYLDWSYYSKGPLVSLCILASRFIFGETIFAVRFPALLFSIFSIFIFHSLFMKCFESHTENKHKSEKFFLLAYSVVGIWYPFFFMTTDAPVIFFFLLTFYLISKFLLAKSEARKFFLLTLTSSSIGLGIWSKYTAFVLFISLFLTIFCLEGSFRKKVIYVVISSIVLLIFLAPIIYWNYQHGWVNFFHNASHASKGVSSGINLKFFGEFLLSQLGLYGLFFPVMIYAIFNKFKSKFNFSAFEIFTLSTTLLLFGLCFFVSFTKRVYPNWTIPVYFSLFLLSLNYLANFFNLYPRISNLFYRFNLFTTVLSILLLLGLNWGLPGKILPTKKLVGWNELVKEIETLRVNSAVNLEGKDKPLKIMTESYGLASQYAFLSGNLKSIFCVPITERRMNQFDIWNEAYNFQDLKGEDILIVVSSDTDISHLLNYFDELLPHPIKDHFYYTYNSSKVRDVKFYIGKKFSGDRFSKPVTF